MMRYILCIGLVVYGGPAAAEDRAAELVHVNAALKAWLQAIEVDAPYMLVDRGAAELRLMHGKAVLRRMEVIADSLGIRPPARVLVAERLRRFRPSNPWSHPAPSPFDWEQNLVADAPVNGALYCTGGTLVFAGLVWRRPGVAALQIAPADFRALYNASKAGMPLVILPRGWREATDG